ncbi:MAG: hypothetical protein K0R19_2779 [Bacillota bacterium]|nr:hypothetical protein [Bacillota bacterium]
MQFCESIPELPGTEQYGDSFHIMKESDGREKMGILFGSKSEKRGGPLIYEMQEMITLPVQDNLCFTFEQMNINSTFQGLWTRLAVLMRSSIYSSLLNLSNQVTIMNALFQLPGDFKDSFQMFYGAEVSQRFANLFTDFLARGTQIVDGVKASDNDMIDQATRGWYLTGNHIATFMGTINLFWDSRQWNLLLNQYINLKVQMVLSIATEDYQREMELLNRVFDLASIMGSYMARGVIARELQKETG